MDLSYRLLSTKRGARLNDSLIINNLLFADDLVIISQDSCTMHFLLAILAKWTIDFKMSISIDKSEIVTSKRDPWELYGFEEDQNMEIKTVKSYKYLGVHITRSIKKPKSDMKKQMVSRSKSYAGALLRLRATDLDQTEVVLNLWRAVGLAKILYGIEAVPPDAPTYKDLDSVQNSMGKAILGV